MLECLGGHWHCCELLLILLGQVLTNKDHELVVTEYEILRFVSTASIVNGGRYFISKLQAISDIKI